MFYSHEVLTSRKYGVATVWLVATLGSKSSLKKVSRKAILDVDVGKACETIVTPDAPMALRLQSNLLYGITRVFSQQCGYVLNDVEAARSNMRTMMRVLQQAGLEPEGGNRAKGTQLILQDDPNYLPELDVMQLNLDDSDFGPVMNDETQFMLSPQRSQITNLSRQSIDDLLIPPSQSSFVGGPVGGLDLLSVRGDSGAGTGRGPPRLLEDDIGLTIEPDGTVRLSDGPGRGSQATSTRPGHVHSIMDEDGQQQEAVRYSDIPDDGFLPLQDDYVNAMDDVVVGSQELQQQTTSETVFAAIRRNPRQKKTIQLDASTQVPNRLLVEWQNQYLNKMQDTMQHKESLRLGAIAKKNAEHWVLGDVLSQGMRGPLDIFSGARILEAFTGINLLSNGQKRPREDQNLSENERRVRARSAKPLSDGEELARGMKEDGGMLDDGFMPTMVDDTIEQGREAPTPLNDHQLSSTFPWNQSAGSRQPTDALATSASFGGGGPLLNVYGRRTSRLTSASPLMGRGAGGGEIDDLQIQGSDIGMTGDEQFELFGPAAQVDTQTAAQSQWQRTALGAESANFLSFVQTAIDHADDRRAENYGDYEGDEEQTRTIDFASLLPPESNSVIVAAQAFMHILTLGTKHLLKADQETSFQRIDLRIIAV